MNERDEAVAAAAADVEGEVAAEDNVQTSSTAAITSSASPIAGEMSSFTAAASVASTASTASVSIANVAVAVAVAVDDDDDGGAVNEIDILWDFAFCETLRLSADMIMDVGPTNIFHVSYEPIRKRYLIML